MEENQSAPQVEDKSKKCCSLSDYCWCKAIAALLIIVLVWFYTPSWANIAITVLAALIILGAGSCSCRSMKKKK